MNKNKIIKEFSKAVKELGNTHDNATYHWYLNTDEDGNDWAIVLGWSDGFDEKEIDAYSDGSYRLCVKLAYQPSNSLMQCDFDIDWMMPYDEISGEVYDTSISIYPDDDMETIINWLLIDYKNYNK